MASTTLDKLRDEVNEIKSSFEKFTRQTTQIISSIEEELANASNDQREWKDVKLKLATTSLKGMVILNVGGDKYTTSVETLTQEEDTFFTALFSKQWQFERDPDDKSIFIDRDGKLFAHLLAYLRTNQVPNDTLTNESLRCSLIIEAEYFRFRKLLNILREVNAQQIDPTFLNSTLLDREQKVKLNGFYGNRDQKWQLIYKASRDGFDVNAFHSRCDSKGPTMTIIRSNNNYLFGGYTSVAWASDNSGFKNDTNAFLFTLTNPHNIPPTKYQINPTKAGNAVFHYNSFGPWFGNGNDLLVQNNSNLSNTSCTTFPGAYIDTTGKGNNTFTGENKFATSDIEVFQLVA